MSDPQAGNGSSAHAPRNVTITAAQLDIAVGRGIISDAQRQRLLEMGGVPVDSAEHGESRQGFDIVAVGYWVGSVAVLFALGWFLIDRWKSLTPAGILVVALLYALAFGLSAFLCARLGFRIASGLLTLLTVGMTPIVAWSIEALLGIWPAGTIQRGGPFTTDVIATIRWIPIELATALAGLVALRIVRFGLLTLAVTIPIGLSLVQLTPWIFDPELDPQLAGWTAILVSTLLVGAAVIVQQRARDDQDHASWVYLTAMGFFVVGFISVADQSRAIPHSLPLVIALLITLGVMLARRIFLLVASILFVGYLGFLAGDVFPTAVGFMIVMLAAGVLVILLTVGAQRRFPALVRRLSADRGDVAPSRAVRLLLPALVAVALVLLVIAVPRARERQIARWAAQRESIRQAGEARRAREAVQRARARQGVAAETVRTPPP